MANKKPESEIWTQDDAVALRSAVAVTKMLRILIERLPRNKDALTTEHAANIGMQQEGFLRCIDQIKQMREDQNPTESPEQFGSIQ